MTARPSKTVPVLATDAAYDDPPEDWDNQPTKVEYTANELAQGVVPGKGLLAPKHNDLLNRYGQYLSYLDDTVRTMQVRNWTSHNPITSNDDDVMIGAIWWKRVGGQEHWVIFGGDGDESTLGSEAYTVPTPETGFSTVPAGYDTIVNKRINAAASVPGDSLLFVGDTDNSDTVAAFTRNNGSTWDEITLHSGLNFQLVAAIYDDVEGKFLIASNQFGGGTFTMWRSDGPLFTASSDISANYPGFSDSTDVVQGMVYGPGTGTTIIYGRAAVDVDSVMVTHDCGDTWDEVDLPNIDLVVGLAYDESQAMWMVLGDDGQIAYSLDNGDTWSAGTAIGYADDETGPAEVGQNVLASNNHGLWAVLINGSGSSELASVVYWTTDLVFGVPTFSASRVHTLSTFGVSGLDPSFLVFGGGQFGVYVGSADAEQTRFYTSLSL